MANPTTNFGWVMPTSTSLVTNLPADFNTFGQGVDTSLQYLLGGTTGQVLSKTSNTNMAFTWVTPTDQTPLTTKGDLFAFSTVDARLPAGANETRLVADSAQTLGLKYVADTTNYAINAKGDLLAGTAADTLTALTVGANNTVLTADSSTSTGLKWATPSSGGMTVIQSGSFSSSSTLISSIPTTYKQLLLQIDAWYLSSTGWGLYLRLNDDSTASRYYNNVAFATTGQTAFNAAKLDLTMDNFGLTTSGYGSVTCYLPNYASTTSYKQAIITGVGQGNSTNPTYFTYQANGGLYNQLTAITSLRINNGAGATQAGTYTLYGVS